MDKKPLTIVLIVIAVISIVYNMATVINNTNQNMEEIKEEMINQGYTQAQYIEIKPSKEYQTIWASLNIMFYLFFLSLIYGRSEKVIQTK